MGVVAIGFMISILFLSSLAYAPEISKGTFPVLTGTPEAFIQEMKDQPGVKVIRMNAGQTIE